MITKSTASGNSTIRDDSHKSGSGLLDSQLLIKVANNKMPFGKYEGKKLIELPEPYLVWFSNQGFPNSPLGGLLELTYEIKVNGLESLVYPLQKQGKAEELV